MATQRQQEFTEGAPRDGALRGVSTQRQILDLRRRGIHPEWFERLLEQYRA